MRSTLAILPLFFLALEADADRARPWLGVVMDSAPARASEGVRVTQVLPTSPAERAGMNEGDSILKVDTSSVGSPDEVTRLVASHSVGDVVTITLRRAEGSVSLPIKLALRPSPEEMVRAAHVGKFARPWIGAEAVGRGPSRVEQLRGRVVVLEFWATWCGPCRLTAPVLSGLQARYGAQGLSVVGIAAESKEHVTEHVQKSRPGFAVTADPKGDTSRAYNVTSLPTMFVLDRRGVIRDVVVGYDPSYGPQLESVIKNLLSEPTIPPP